MCMGKRGPLIALRPSDFDVRNRAKLEAAIARITFTEFVVQALEHYMTHAQVLREKGNKNGS